MPNEYPEDALHIAICALNGIDYMLTWNCAHIANATMRRQVEQFLEASDAQSVIAETGEHVPPVQPEAGALRLVVHMAEGLSTRQTSFLFLYSKPLFLWLGGR